MPYAASRPTTAPRTATSLSWADAVASKVEDDLVRLCGWHGMQGVRGFKSAAPAGGVSGRGERRDGFGAWSGVALQRP
jgi:hypothetical protein